MLCPACGSKMNDDERFCRTCGTLLMQGPKVRNETTFNSPSYNAAESGAKKAADKAAAQRAADKAAAQRAADEAEKKAAKREAEEAKERAAAKKSAEEAEKRAAKKAAEEAEERAAAKRAAEEAEERAAAKRAAEEAEERAAAKRAAEEAAAKRAAEEAAKRAAEEAAKRAAEEAVNKAAEEAAAKRAAEEAAKRDAEEAVKKAAKRAAEEAEKRAAAKKAAEEAAAVEAAIESALKSAQETAAKRAAEEAAMKKAAEAAEKQAAEEAAAKKAAEVAENKAAEEAAMKKAAEAVEKKAAGKADVNPASPVTRLSYKIAGGIFPSISIALDENQSIFTQSDVMVWMSPGIDIETKTKRNGSSFTAKYTSGGYGQEISIASRFPGEIQVLNIGGGAVIVQKEAFLAAQPTVVLSSHVSMNMGDEHNASISFQRLSGSGMAFIAISGSLIERVLGSEETIKADTANIAAFEESVSFQTQIISDFQNTVFGKGLFLSTLTGPGKIWLQTLPVHISPMIC